MMTVELIYDLDCPNVVAARSQLLKAFSQTGVRAVWSEWDRSSDESPSHARQYGSPTILVNGRDVAGEQPSEQSTCCRLYRDEKGRMQGMPSVEIICLALQSAKNRVTPSSSPASKKTIRWQHALATLPGVVIAFLPNIACPACWPAYAGLLSLLGLGFLLQTQYLLPMTVVFLVLAVGALAFRARTRRGYGPFLIGIGAAVIILVGKFIFNSDALMYSGIGVLVTASMWNAWPVNRNSSCPACKDNSSTTHYEKEVLL